LARRHTWAASTHRPSKLGVTKLLFSVSFAILAVYGQPRFEVASVKPGSADAIGSMNGGPLPIGPFNQTNHDPGRITWTNVRLGRVMQVAYDLPADRISGPDWLVDDVVSMVATIPAGTSVGDFRLMVQNLLADRFKLTVHRETKQVSGYALEVGKNGPKLNESGKNSKGEAQAEDKRDQACRGCNAIVIQDESGFPAPRPGTPIFLPGAAFSATIAVNGKNRASVLNGGAKAIADYLGNALGSPVEDRTGLTGIYDVRLEFVPDPSGTEPNATGAAASDPGTGIFDAVQSQLGLKLTPKKVPVETLVIDHLEKVPTEN
jgi:uncharacterized protein (TIGR03435 family)